MQRLRQLARTRLRGVFSLLAATALLSGIGLTDASSATAASAPVKGYVDDWGVVSVSGHVVGFTARGWTFDNRRPDLAIKYEVKIDQTVIHTETTYLTRRDVNAAFGITGFHGYATSYTKMGPGQHIICVYGISLDGQRYLLTNGCKGILGT